MNLSMLSDKRNNTHKEVLYRMKIFIELHREHCDINSLKDLHISIIMTHMSIHKNIHTYNTCIFLLHTHLPELYNSFVISERKYKIDNIIN